MNVVEAGRQALALWDLAISDISVVKVRENAVLRAESNVGPLAVRLHRTGYHTDAELRSELSWMRALRNAGIDVPTVLPSRAQSDFEVIPLGTSETPTQVDVLRWVSGTPLGSVESGIDGDMATVTHKYHMLGALTAQLHNQASTWAPPSDFTRHAWDADGLAGERPVWGRFWELRNLTSAQRSTLEHARSRLRRDLLDFGTDARVYSLIHADLVPDNLLVDGDTMRVLDFDDCGFGWHLFDVATVFYTMRTRDYFDAAKTAFLGAYRTVRPLTDEDLSLMPMFTAARALTYLGWLHTRGDGNPDSEKRAAASTVATVQEYVS